MSDAAKRLLMLQTWLEVCLTDKRLDAEAYLTQCRIREQAAYIIGCGLLAEHLGQNWKRFCGRLICQRMN